jgi:septum formation protein
MNEIILASASIGRKRLFQQYFSHFITSPSHIDETKVKLDDPRELTKKLAFFKSMAISKFYQNDFVIGLDTVVVCEGKIVGKPKDLPEAKEMLRFLSGKRQSVITGFCIINRAKDIIINEYAETVLYFKQLSDDFIEVYVKSHPVTKFAGGYAAQDNDDFIDIEHGDIENVIGAPMEMIITILREHGISKTFFRNPDSDPAEASA